MSFNWATYSGATGCIKYGPAGCQALLTYLEDRFPHQWSKGICNCRSVNGGSSYSHHAECRAYDQGMPIVVGQALGYEVVKVIGPHGRELGVDHIITNKQPWSSTRGQPYIFSARSPEGRVYTGAHPHKDHNHIGLTRSSGRNLTYATLVSVLGPATPEGDDDMLLKKGDKGQSVAELQKIMAEKFGQNNGTWTPFAGRSPFDGAGYGKGEDGDFGGTCETNVKNVQGNLGQTKTGVVDQLLWDALVDQRYGGAEGDHSGLATKSALSAVKGKLDGHVAAKTSGPHS